MAATSVRSIGVRARRAMSFVAITWGIATTFVIFEVVSLSSLDLVLAYPALFGDIALSRTVTRSTSCDVRPGRETGRRSPDLSLSDTNVGAWFLGINLGRDALLRQYVRSNPEAFEQLTAAREDLARRLAVPAPTRFIPQQMATANVEFIDFVETGISETTHALAEAFSPRTCHLFKLGAYWGYSEMVRPSLAGERAVFAMEIRYHALRAEVPESLWSPMFDPLPADSKSEDVTAQMTALTNGVTAHLSAGR